MDCGRVIVVGASHAAAQLSASLRQDGWDGEILMIGGEPSLPYQRPPLSKAYLSGAVNHEELLIRKPDFYEKKGVTFRHAWVSGIDAAAKALQLSDGETVSYDQLVLSLGARPRLLEIPGATLEGVHYLRDTSDVEAIRQSLPTTRHAVIVGAGYVGLETAASLRSLGITVTVLEVAERVLERVTAPDVSSFYDRVHREEGVDLRVATPLVAIQGESRVKGVRLETGEVIAADMVIVGIGVVPNVELAEAAGLAVDNGIVIDQHGRTTDPSIFAAGDCANYFDARYDCRVRLESVPSAVEQAKTVSATICGKHKEISALPWFWSDQYDLKLQIAGVNRGYDQTVMRGDPVTGRDFACFYLRDGQIIAADCINRPQEFMFSKRAIAAGLTPDPQLLGDSEAALADLLTTEPAPTPG